MKALMNVLMSLVLMITSLTGKMGNDIVRGNSSAEETAGEYTETVNSGTPYFTKEEISGEAYLSFAGLDSLGRAGEAVACLGPGLLPTESRTTRMSYRPSGWNQETYDIIPEEYLYNRCHLIAYCLCGDEGSPENLITGTAWLNLEEMLPIETKIVRYIERTGNHVMYRVTPTYYGNDLVAYGVLVEALSVEDGGRGVCICEMLYNVQPGIEINYANGSSRLA